MFSEKRLDRLRHIASHWTVLGGSSKHVKESYQGAEALLHEVCHALEMGIRINVHAPIRVSQRFDELDEQSPVLGLVHEAKVLAIQYHAVGFLGWQKVVPMKRIVRQIWSNGLSGKALPLLEFRKMYRRFCREDNSRDMGFTASEAIHHLADTRERRRRKNG